MAINPQFLIFSVLFFVNTYIGTTNSIYTARRRASYATP